MATPIDFSGANPVGTPSATDVFSAGSEAISFREQLPDLETKLRDALTTKFNESPLFKTRETAQREFLAAPSALNKKITDIQTGGTILSPNQQQEITGAGRAAAFAPLSTNNLLLNAQFGGLENMIGGGVKAFEAAGAKGKRADLLNTMRQQEMQRQMQEKQLSLGYARLNKEGSVNKAQQSAMLEFSQIPTILQQLKEKQSLARGRVSGFGSRVKALLGIQPDVTSYEAYKNAVATPIARTLFGEKGNLSDTDIKRAIGLLPTATDTADEAEQKLMYIEQLANSKYQAILQLGSDIGESDWEIIQ